MKNAKKRNFFSLLSILMLCVIMAISFLGYSPLQRFTTNAESRYCDDMYLDDRFNGEGTFVKSSYEVNYDRKEETIVSHFSVPSYGNADPAIKSACATLTGMNIVAYYDRWYNNLVPNYEVGLVHPNTGDYFYLPDMHTTATCGVITSLYQLMKTDEEGTTAANFKSGLKTYINNAGYNLSTTSFYRNTKTVDINKLETAINQGKVGLIMCSTYNIVSSITTNEAGTLDYVAKRNSDAGHMMMVYGYLKNNYYKDEVNFQTDTFLLVCSSFSSGEKGFIRLNDYMRIDEALIVSIS